jgi:hypothetical protein
MTLNSLKRMILNRITLCVVIAFSIGAIFFGATACRGKTVVDLYILSGQSNAVGIDDISTYTPSSTSSTWKYQSNVMFWAGSNAATAFQNKWSALQVGASGVNGGKAFGPELTFGYDMAAANPSSKIAIVKYAVGGAGLARSSDYTDVTSNANDGNNNFHPASDGKAAGSYYTDLLNNVTNSIAALESQGYTVHISGVLWMQGEREACDSVSMAKDYSNLLTDLISSLRTDLKVAHLPVVVGQLADSWYNNDPRNFAIVQNAQKSVCDADPFAGLVVTKDLDRPAGDAHYSANGMALLGSRMATEMQSLHAPEPGTFAMFTAAAAGLFGYAWRKRGGRRTTH